MYDIIVIGAGPAGLIAAAKASQCAKVAIVEKNTSPGKKLLITGNGRCNLTRIDMDPRALAKTFGDKERFILPALKALSPMETVKFFEKNGLKITEEENRIYPASNKAEDVLSTLLAILKKNKVELICGKRITDIILEDKKISCLTTGKNQTLQSNKYILCTGGVSFPQTGSTGDGYPWAEKTGHRIIKPLPALAPLISPDTWIRAMEGISLRAVGCTLYNSNGEKKGFVEGDILFTSRGVSGPGAMDISAAASRILENGPVILYLDILPDKTLEEADEVLQAMLKRSGARMVKNTLSSIVPERLLAHILKESALDGEEKTANISRDKRRRMAENLKSLKINISHTGELENAIVTSGGVALDDVDRKTMKSRHVENLYFAGEILDIDGRTGGYNLQMCWSTGWLAGHSASRL